MTTIVDGLTDATAELRTTRIAVQALADAVTAQLAAKTNAAQTVINNFVNAATKNYLVDPVAGDDTKTGFSPDTALKTIDKAFERIAADGSSVFGAAVFLLGDCVMRKRWIINAPIAIVGAEWGGGQFGSPYHNVQRNLSFLAEATNSPVSGLGRSVPGVNLFGAVTRLQNITVTLPDVGASIDFKNIFPLTNGGSIYADQFNVLTATPGTMAYLFGATAPASFYVSGTIGANVAGKLFFGVGAGQNPNAVSFLYRTNLISA